MMLRLCTLTGALMAAVLLSGCGEPIFENAGSHNSLVEDQQACAVEVAKSPVALAYRQNPAAHPDYQSLAFADMIVAPSAKGGELIPSPIGATALGNEGQIRLFSAPHPPAPDRSENRVRR